MAQQANVPQPSSTSKKKSSKKKSKPRKIFGVMTKRRWFGVVVFLSAMLWSYTAGPPLNKTIICNRYFMDGTSYNYSTVAFSGNLLLINSIFSRGFWPDVFTWQIGSYFSWTEGPLWSSKYNKLYFSDTISNKIFSWSVIDGIQIELNNAGNCNENELNNLYKPGTNGLIQNPINNDIIFITQHAKARIIEYNLNTKQTSVVADNYNGIRFNSPNDMTIGPNNEYIYFTDPPHGLISKNESNSDSESVDSKSSLGYCGIYRVSISAPHTVELLDNTMKRPNGILFSSDYDKLFVSNCIQGKFELNVFKFNNKNGNIKLIEKWDESSIFENNNDNNNDNYVSINPLNGGVGCVNGMDILNNKYLITTCPGGKLCIINQKNGNLDALIKLPDKTSLSNVIVGGDSNLYVTGNHTVWQIKLKQQS